MTTILIPSSPNATTAPGAAAGFRGQLLSEWTKVRSVRSTIWALVALVVVTTAFSGLLNWLTVSQWDAFDEAQRQLVRADPTSQILGAGFQFSQLAICVLGVLVITSEYSSGTIRATLLAVPRRTPVLVAKTLVFAALVFVVAEFSALISFLVGAAILNTVVDVTLADQGVPQAILGAGLYAAVLGVFAIAIGALLRHTAAAITGIIGFVLVLSPLALLLPGDWGRFVYAYLPTNAGQRITTTIQGPDDLLSAWQGLGVFALWTLALLLLADYLLRRRDA